MKPMLYAGRPIPFGVLAPDEFERFVTIILGKVGPRHGFREIRKTSGPTENGFDAVAHPLEGRGVICIQCKRYQSALSVRDVALELAKVALQSASEGSTVQMHLLVTSGKVSKNLESAIREDSKRTLCSEAESRALLDPELKLKREEVEKRGLDVREVVSRYVRDTAVIAWSAEQLDIECTSIWSELADTLDRYFTLERVLVEHPRPDFDEAQYLKSLRWPSDRFVALDVRQGELPLNVTTRSRADPLEVGASLQVTTQPKSRTETENEVSITQDLANSQPGAGVLLVGQGGSGKTTTLHMVLIAAAQRRLTDKNAPLPILLELGHYRGRLDELIHERLGITHGNWRSLPGNFLLLCDGLNEVPLAELTRLGDELSATWFRQKTSQVVTVRSGGLRSSTRIGSIQRVLHLDPLKNAQMNAMATKVLGAESAGVFLRQFRERLASPRFRIAALPFGFATALATFASSGVVPTTDAELIEQIIAGRLARDRELPSELIAGSEIPDETLRTLGGEIAFHLRIVLKQSAMTRAESQNVLSQVLRSLRSAGVYGTEALTDIQAFAWMRHTELLVPSPDGRWVSFRHELIADYLAASVLARQWVERLDALGSSSISDDAWYFASLLIPEAERLAYIESLADVELVLAAQCAVNMGSSAQTVVFERAKDCAATDRHLAFSEATIAMGVLRTQESISWLKDYWANSQGTDPGENPQLAMVLRALARCGDREVLKTLLEDAEPLASGPWTRVTSGGISIWKQAAPQIALEVARERVAESPNQPIRLSLQTIARYGDASDVPLLEKVIKESKSFQWAADAFFILYRYDAALATSLVHNKRRICDPLVSMLFMSVLSIVGEMLDVGELLACLLEEVSSDSELTQGEKEKIRETALEILKKSVLDDSVRIRIREAYDHYPERRNLLWRLAGARQLDSFDELALRLSVTAPPLELGFIANFAGTRSWAQTVETEFVSRLKKRLETDGSLRNNSWCFSRVGEYLVLRGERELVAGLVAERLAILGDAQTQIDRGESVTPSWTDLNLPAHYVKYDVEMEILRLLPLASLIADSLPLDSIRCVLRFNLSSVSKENMSAVRSLFRRIEDDEIDREIAGTKHELRRAALLAIASGLGPTPRRLEIFRDMLSVGLGWLAVGSKLALVLGNFWAAHCALLLDAVVNAVARAELENRDQLLMASSLLEEIPDRMTKELAEQVVMPILQKTRAPQAQKVLRFWYDIGIRSRLE